MNYRKSWRSAHLCVCVCVCVCACVRACAELVECANADTYQSVIPCVFS